MGDLTGSREPSPKGLGPSGFDPDREMVRAWQSIRGKADFTKQPVWSGMAPSDLSRPLVRTADTPPTKPTPAYEFRIRYLEDNGRTIAAAIFGRQHGASEWLPVEPIPLPNAQP